MPVFSLPASLLCLLLRMSVTLQRSDLRPDLAYVTQSSCSYYSCSQEPPPCSTTSLTDCRCRDVQPASAPHRPRSHACPAVRAKSLTVWFTSSENTARLLNNSEVRHLTLIYCGPGGARRTPSIPLEEYFAVQHLEKLTVVHPDRSIHPCPDATKAKTTDSNIDPDTDNSAHLDLNRFNRDRDTYLDLIMDLKKDLLSLPPKQDIFLGLELGAAYQEQARLGIIHSSVLESGAKVKAYTVQTHIDSDGSLPFKDLHLDKLPETSVIYVSFVY